MTDQPTELTLLHDAMVECGIWPDERDNRLFWAVPGHRKCGYGEHLIEDVDALHLMRGIAEEWLRKQGVSRRCGWDATYSKIKHAPHGQVQITLNSLPAALRYAHGQKGVE